jgi:hypothetical protein
LIREEFRPKEQRNRELANRILLHIPFSIFVDFMRQQQGKPGDWQANRGSSRDDSWRASVLPFRNFLTH